MTIQKERKQIAGQSTIRPVVCSLAQYTPGHQSHCATDGLDAQRLSLSAQATYLQIKQHILGNEYGASGRKTVYESLRAAKRRILVAIHLRVREILNGNRQRDLVLKARHSAGETLSALAREFKLTPQHVYQIVKSNE